MKKDSINKIRRTYFVLLLLLLWYISWMPSVQGQESPAARIPSESEVQFKVVKHGHAWRPPYGLDRVGQSYDVVITIQTKDLPSGEFTLISYSLGKKLSNKIIQFTNRIPFSGRLPNPGGPANPHIADQFGIYYLGNQAFTDKTGDSYTGKANMIENTDQVALLFTATGKDPVELARQAINMPSFEAEAVAKPDKVINPVDLNSILVPANWLLLAGGQKAYVTVAALNRGKNNSAAKATAWYKSLPQNRVSEELKLSPGNKVQKELSLPECSRTLENDTLNVSIEDAKGNELWHKKIKVMIVPNPPTLPSFGVVKTKLRYDSPIINIVDGKNVPLDYDKLWKPEFEDLVVCLPNGSRWVFWRGTSYIPVWAGQYNTGLSYQWAEGGLPIVNFVDCIEPLMDKELRYGSVEIVESSNARIHVRWKYQSCDFNYTVNGDLAVEDYYFYPDGFGTRVLTITYIPKGEYEIEEFIILSPPAAFPLDFLPFKLVDIIPINKEEKSAIYLPEWYALYEADEPWKKINGPSMYRIRMHKNEPLSAIIFCPNLSREIYPPVNKPYVFGPFFDNGYLVSPAYWGGHWPLSRGFNTSRKINESIWTAPAHNSLTTFNETRPKPIKSTLTETKDAFGVLKPMQIDTWAWLIGMTDANDDALVQIAKSYAKPPLLELTGAKQDQEPYSFESRAMRLVVDNRKVTIKIKPDGWCVNPIFELKNASKKLQEIKLGGKVLPTDKYAWDGNTLWLNTKINQPIILELRFNK
jgi:hypothetical protein